MAVFPCTSRTGSGALILETFGSFLIIHILEGVITTLIRKNSQYRI